MTADFLDTYLPYLLRQADQELSAAFYDALNGHGVQRSEWRVLAVLAGREPMSMRDLTDIALSPQPTVTHAVTRLEKRGLVQRLQGTEDRRQRFVSVTESGAALAAQLIQEAQELEAAALARIETGDLSGLINELRLLIDNLKETRSD
jgi:DNA-binding MarR family transcriptional regulator